MGNTVKEIMKSAGKRMSKKGTKVDTGDGSEAYFLNDREMSRLEAEKVAWPYTGIKNKVVTLDAEKSLLIATLPGAAPKAEPKAEPKSKAKPESAAKAELGKGEPTPDEPKEQGAKEKVEGNGDYLTWVSMISFQKAEDFTKFAVENNICKKLRSLPGKMSLGVTKVFFAHDEMITGDAVILGYAVVEKIERIQMNGEGNGTNLDPRVVITKLKDTEQRVWGVEVGKMYFTGTFVKFDEPLDYNALIDPEAVRFKGLREVNGDMLLESGKTKTLPSQRKVNRIQLTDDLIKVAETHWDPKELFELARLIKKYNGKKYPAIREYAASTNRTLRACEYQIYKNLIPGGYLD